MRSRTRLLVGLGLGLTLCGCGSSTSSTPPSSSTTPDQPPAATDTLIFTSDIYAASPNKLLEVYSLDSNNPGTPTRLTFTNQNGAGSNLEASSAPGRSGLAVRRVVSDTNGDGVLDDADNAELVYVAFTTPPAENIFVSANQPINGLDFSPAGSDIVYSAPGTGGTTDIWDVASNGTNNFDVTSTPAYSERRPRYDTSGSILTFEYVSPGQQGAVYIYDQNGNEDAIDLGVGGGSPLPGTLYRVGGNADPSFAPAGSAIVFRRLTGIPNTVGTWDLLTTNGTGSTALVTGGNLYRGAPDWGSTGILYVETDPAAGTSSIILIAPDGSGRRLLYTAPQGYTVSNPRWLR
jgi:hypothetical protein